MFLVFSGVRVSGQLAQFWQFCQFSKNTKNTKNTVFLSFRPLRIISKIQSAANYRVFDILVKTDKIKPEWVVVLAKLTEINTVYGHHAGNTF